VKQPGTLVRHDDREYLLVEGGFNPATRAIILLARPDDTTFPRAGDTPSLRWGVQGDWQPVARWTAEGLQIPNERHAGRSALVQKLIDDYRAKSAPRPTIAWAVQADGCYAGAIEVALPMGFAAFCHESRERAAAIAGEEHLVPVENLAMFFTHLVREGYAGALWNGDRPVFFCVDEQQDLQFLRLGTTPKGDGVVMEILDPKDAWSEYEGAEELEFIDNSEACDNRLVECLGRTPVMGWPEGGRLYSAGPRFGVPLVIHGGEGKDAVPHGVLFTTEVAATEFSADAGSEPGEEPLAVFPVNDLQAFLTQSELEGCVAALNPGGHRASSGILWSDGERVVLDTFSGFWKVAPGGSFELLE
jgi:hypothetical protein